MRLALPFLRLLGLAPRWRGEPWAGIQRDLDLCIAMSAVSLAGTMALLVMLFRINEALP
jgi:hypothetical protein